MNRRSAARLDWSTIELVVFDLDGTLYDAQRLRLAMLGLLLKDAWGRRSLKTLRLLRSYRRIREALAEQGSADVMRLQYEIAAAREGCTPEALAQLVHDWMEERPLPLLRRCRRPQVERLFEGLRQQGKQVAVLSDYPAPRKLQALELHAWPVVSASDEGIQRLKPDPAGLRAILERTGIPAPRAVMVGDRLDRDAAVAARVGMTALVRGARSRPGVIGFRRFDDALFQPVLATGLPTPAPFGQEN